MAQNGSGKGRQSLDLRLFRRLLAYAKPYRLPMVSAVLLIIFSSFLQLIGPLVTAAAIDLFIEPESGATLAPMSAWLQIEWADKLESISPREGLALCALILLFAEFMTFVVLLAQSYVMQMMGQKIMRDLRREIFAHLQELSISYFDHHPVGRLVTRVTTDVQALSELFTAGLVSIFGDLALLLGIVGVLFWLDWRLALITFSILPFLMAQTVWFKGGARRSYREVRVKIARINSFFSEHLSGMSVVQLFGQERRTYQEFDEVNRGHRDANIRAIFYYAVYFPAVELITSVGLALILWYGGGQIIRGAASLGALMAFLQLSQRFYRPLADLSEKYNIVQSAMASSERIFQLLDTEVEIKNDRNSMVPSEVQGHVEFRNVEFGYVPEEPVLRDLSFQIQSGEMVAIVGPTGAGKSTIASLLLRFYDVQKGAILVDEIDLRQWDLRALRHQTGIVLQDVFLFSGSLRSNLSLGDESISDDKLRWALQEVGGLSFLDSLGGLSAEVRERGAGLSVGQKQLLAFARALVFDPKILILDEATSSIDTYTEHLIQEALKRLLVGRTSVVIAHRLSTIRRADRILVLHKGCLREQGTHEELLAQGGIYERLYRLQYKDQIAG